MKIYLLEVWRSKAMIPVGVFNSRQRARVALGDGDGLVTELEVDTYYPPGIGLARHWHYGAEEEDPDALPLR